MAHVEIDSFVSKFKHLCNSGLSATLNLESYLGKATVTFKVEVGICPPNLVPHQRYRGQAYQRRLIRRSCNKNAEMHEEDDTSENVDAKAAEKVDVNADTDGKVEVKDVDGIYKSSNLTGN